MFEKLYIDYIVIEHLYSVLSQIFLFSFLDKRPDTSCMSTLK